MPQLQEPLQKCIAVYDNVAECEDELAFRAGDVLTVLEQDTAGLMGWWLCTLRGRQGICPGNRLKLITETDQALQKEGKRRSWHAQPNKVVMPQKYGDVYLYDMPPSRPNAEQFQYDIPPSMHPPCHQQTNNDVVGGENYDVPRPLQAPLTPSSSVSSLTTDSNRSSLIQEYDVPRPPRYVPQPQVYDVPKELPLEMNSALDYLGRLESETTGAISRLLAYAGPHWRQHARLEPRILEIKLAVLRLRTSLHDLAHFSESTLANAANAHDKGLSGKLKPLVTVIKEADREVEELSRVLDTTGWTCAALCVQEPERHTTDALDRIITCATHLTDDVRQIASFIQGNSTLLFKRSLGMTWAEDYDYVNLESREAVARQNEEIREVLPPELKQGFDKVIQEAEKAAIAPPLDPADKQVMSFYAGECATHSSYLTNAIEAFFQTVERNQPPKVFLAHIKFVVLSAHRLVNIGDTVFRNVSCDPVRNTVLSHANALSEALAVTVHKTKLAALHFPSVTAVQEMVDSVMELSHNACHLKRSMITKQP